MLLWVGPNLVNQANLNTAINYFKNQGFAVLLGVAQNFRNDFSQYFSTYALADVIFVWCNGISYQGIQKTVLL